jgi:hypothetical protein
VLNTWSDFGEKPLCIGDKSLIEDLKSHPDKSPKVQFMNFVGLRGDLSPNISTMTTMRFPANLAPWRFQHEETLCNTPVN